MSARFTSSRPKLCAPSSRNRTPRERASAASSLAGIMSPTVLRQVGHRHHLGARRDRLGEGVDVVLGAGMRVLLRHDHHREAEALRLLLPRGQVARVVVLVQQHLVAGLEVQAVRHHVVRLAGVARDDDLVGRHAQELGQRLARRFLLGHQPGAVVRRRIAVDALRLSRVRPRRPAATPGTGWRRSSPPGPGGITNCSRTLFQNGSPADGPAGSSAGRRRRPCARSRVREERGRAADREQLGERAARDGGGLVDIAIPPAGQRPGDRREYTRLRRAPAALRRGCARRSARQRPSR